jgi:hypothetical protein
LLALDGASRRLWLYLPGAPGPTDPAGSAGQSTGTGAAAGQDLWTPQAGAAGGLLAGDSRFMAGLAGVQPLTCYHLVEGTSERVPPDLEAIRQALTRAPGPAVLMARAA